MNECEKYGIPEGDKVCINCRYFICLGDCKNNRPLCINYSTKGTVNHFVPDEDYLKDKFGCKACNCYNDGEYMYECKACMRHYNDLWERGEA